MSGLMPDAGAGLMPDAVSGLMPDAAQAVAFALAVLVLNATPGADLLLTLGRSLQAGARAGVATALGINAGCVVHALATAFGLAAVLAVQPGVFTALQWAGAAYLAWLGLGLWRQAARRDAEGGVPAAGLCVPEGGALASFRADFRSGLLTNVLNPKVAFFFLAFLPPFVPAASPSRTASFLLLGAWFVGQSTVFLLMVVALAGRVRRWQTSPPARRLAQALGGTLFLWLAWRLLGARPATA